MSLQPVTYWTVHCDGDTTRGTCSRAFQGWDNNDEPSVTPERFATRAQAEKVVSAYGWLVTGQRFLCPAHVAALNYLARAEAEGLPFEDPRSLRQAVRGEQ